MWSIFFASSDRARTPSTAPRPLSAPRTRVVEELVGDVLYARRETEAGAREESEDGLGEARGVHCYRELRLVAQDTVEDVGGVADR